MRGPAISVNRRPDFSRRFESVGAIRRGPWFRRAKPDSLRRGSDGCWPLSIRSEAVRGSPRRSTASGASALPIVSTPTRSSCSPCHSGGKAFHGRVIPIRYCSRLLAAAPPTDRKEARRKSGGVRGQGCSWQRSGGRFTRLLTRRTTEISPAPRPYTRFYPHEPSGCRDCVCTPMAHRLQGLATSVGAPDEISCKNPTLSW